jgi:rubredoxin
VKAVTLDLAYVWECPTCGYEQFARSVFKEFSPEEQAEIQADEGFRPLPGHWVTHPDEVTCEECSAVFRALSRGQEDDGGPEGEVDEPADGN